MLFMLNAHSTWQILIICFIKEIKALGNEFVLLYNWEVLGKEARSLMMLVPVDSAHFLTAALKLS
jgi:hypothetical protein